MRLIYKSSPVAIALFCVVAVASAGHIDFESIAQGTYKQYDFGDFVLSAQDGRDFDVLYAEPGDPISGHSIGTWKQNRNNRQGGPHGIVAFYGFFEIDGVNEFSIGVGDYG